jgi:hypothetical protein
MLSLLGFSVFIHVALKKLNLKLSNFVLASRVQKMKKKMFIAVYRKYLRLRI